MNPIPDEVLLDYLEGRLSPSDVSDLEQRLAGNQQAQQRLHELRRAQCSKRAAGAAPGGQPRAGVRSLIVRLSRDSWRSAGQATGLRSLQAWPRALILRAGDRELDLQIAPHGERWQVSGQVLGPEAPGFVLLSGPADQVTTILNELGEFVLPLVTGGRYTLTVAQSDIEIVVPNLEVGPLANMR